MIKLIGMKRVIILSCLLALNLAVAAVWLTTISPMREEAEMQRNGIDGQISDLQGKITHIKEELKYLEDNLPKYTHLRERGFFLNQDRFMIGRMMEDLRQKAGIASFAFEIADVEDIPNADAAAMNHRLVNSRIKVRDIKSPLDNNVYVLMQEISKAFPEYARIQSIDMTRKGDVDEASLQKIKSGEPISFVDSNIVFDWMTLIPMDAQAAPAPGMDPSQGGFRAQ